MAELKPVKPGQTTTSENGKKQMSELEVLIRARYPLIYVISWEEQRVMAEVTKIASRLGKNVEQTYNRRSKTVQHKIRLWHLAMS
jgi:uncharacterized protein Veg